MINRNINSRKNKNKSLIKVIYQLWNQLNSNRKSQIRLIFLVMILSGFSELVTLASLIPFLSALINPESLWKIYWLRDIANNLGINNQTQLMLPLTLLFCTAAILAASIRLINLWLNQRMATLVGSDLSCRSLKIILHEPYINHTKRNSSSTVATISNHITNTVEVINLILQFFTGLIIVLSLFIGLLIADWKAAIFSALIFGFIYLLIFRKTKNKLALNSKKIVEAKSRQIKSLQEGLGGIRDVLMGGNQNTYINIYRDADYPMRIYEAQSRFIANFPRFALEAFGMILIAGISYFLFIQNNNTTTALSIMAAFALGAQRLLPAMQLCYSSITDIRGNIYAVIEVLKILKKSHVKKQFLEAREKKQFNKKIELKNIFFKYTKDYPYILKNINLSIIKGERIGIVGSTGSGKSTLLEIILGLLNPNKGSVFVDGEKINNSFEDIEILKWRRSISYVPQSIFLTDATIAENVAFGVPYDSIDFDLVKNCLEKASLTNFLNQKKDGLNSYVGERGIQLSGGQLQRIGIARALYKKNEIIAFDESTSALDNKTENEIIESIKNLSRELTIIIIAHRLSTLKYCDRIIKVDNGLLTELKTK